MTDSIASVVDAFVAHRRALGRKYVSEQAELALFVRYSHAHGVDTLDGLTPELLDEFLASRPRTRPRSFNHLLRVVAGMLAWAISNELLESSPLRARPRRVTSQRIPFLFDPAQARHLLNAAALLPDNSRATGRGTTYRAIFGLCWRFGSERGRVGR